MKNIHLLPTDKPSRLFLKENTLLLNNQYTLQEVFPKGKCQNIYITSNEEIKIGDWCIDEKENIVKADKDFIFNCSHEFYEFWKKIILTTDQDLIKDGVQAIDDEFLEFFVKNPSCERVEIGKLFKANPKYKEKTQLTEKVGYWVYKIIIPKETFKQKTKDRIMSETSEETKQKARDYGNSLIKQDRTCTHNCSAVCGECQILEPKPLLSVEWLLRYIEDLNNKGYTFIPSSNKEVVEHIKQMQKDNMIAFLKFVFQQDGFDYEQAYNNFLKQQIL